MHGTAWPLCCKKAPLPSSLSLGPQFLWKPLFLLLLGSHPLAHKVRLGPAPSSCRMLRNSKKETTCRKWRFGEAPRRQSWALGTNPAGKSTPRCFSDGVTVQCSPVVRRAQWLERCCGTMRWGTTSLCQRDGARAQLGCHLWWLCPKHAGGRVSVMAIMLQRRTRHGEHPRRGLCFLDTLSRLRLSPDWQSWGLFGVLGTGAVSQCHRTLQRAGETQNPPPSRASCAALTSQPLAQPPPLPVAAFHISRRAEPALLGSWGVILLRLG